MTVKNRTAMTSFGSIDRERVVRRGEKEIVAERGDDARKQRGPQAELNGDADDGGEEDKTDVFQSDPGPEKQRDADRARDRQRCEGERGAS